MKPVVIEVKDALQKEVDRLTKQGIELLALFETAKRKSSEHYRLKGKIEGVRLAIENINQTIKEL